MNIKNYKTIADLLKKPLVLNTIENGKSWSRSKGQTSATVQPFEGEFLQQLKEGSG